MRTVCLAFVKKFEFETAKFMHAEKANMLNMCTMAMFSNLGA